MGVNIAIRYASPTIETLFLDYTVHEYFMNFDHFGETGFRKPTEKACE